MPRTRKLVLTALVTAVVVAGFAPAARADTTTAAHDPLRTAWDGAEPGLAPSVVGSSSFGSLFSAPVTGQVYAQPLVVGGTVIAATEADAVYGLDGETGAVRWSRSLGPAWPAATIGCGDLTPTIGITSTPVYDPATHAVYLTAKTADGSSPTSPNWYVHALDVATGAERPGWPVRIGGAPGNDPAHPFDAETAAQRPGLLLLDGVVYAGFASHCDTGPFVGYVVGVSTAGRQTAMWSTESGTSFGEAGIWQSGGGLVSDGPGRILFTTGNGISPPPGPGTSPPSTLGESVVRLAVRPDGSLTAADFFSPANNAKLDQDDTDLGSGGPLAVPDGYGTPAHPHLLVQMGKDGRLFVLDRDALGGMGRGAGGGDAALAVAGPYSGVWGRPAFLGTTGGGYVYVVGNGGALRAFRLAPTATGGVGAVAVGASAGTFGYTSGSPVVTSDGTDGSGAVVWVVHSNDATGTGSELRAYAALPDAGGVLRQLWAAPIGTAAKFSSLATSGSRVYVGTRDGRVLGFGAPTTAALGASSTDLGSAPVGGTGQGSVTLTATRPVTVTSLTATAPFAVGPAALPLTLPRGGTASVPVTFAPTAPGQLSGTLTAVTADGETVPLGVHGLGTRDGLGSAPAALAFTGVPTGTAAQQTVTVTNTGTAPVTVTGVTLPASPDLVVDPATVPAVGSVLGPQQSVAVSVRYTPAAAASTTDSLTVASSAGSVTVPLSATSISGAAVLTLPTSLDFGSVPVGLGRTATFAISNSGNIPMTITKAKAPAGVFSTTTPIAEGLVVPPGVTVYQSVTFAPTAVGAPPAAGYVLTADDGSGAHTVALTGTGVSDPIAVLAARDGGSYSKPLGMFLTAEYPVGAGRCQNFTKGVICWSPTTGAHEVTGALASRYASAGGAGGRLGFPTGNVFCRLLNGGCGQTFQGGVVYWSSATGAHVVSGRILSAWTASGRERGRYHYPVAEAYRSGTHLVQRFQGGTITVTG